MTRFIRRLAASFYRVWIAAWPRLTPRPVELDAAQRVRRSLEPHLQENARIEVTVVSTNEEAVHIAMWAMRAYGQIEEASSKTQ